MYGKPATLRALGQLMLASLAVSLTAKVVAGADPSVSQEFYVCTPAAAGGPAVSSEDMRPDPEAGHLAANSCAVSDDGPSRVGSLVWGVLGIRGYAFGQQVAPNGLEFNPLFSLDVDLNIWLWRQERLYAFADTRFWGQKAGLGVTNPSQGIFDFSKREFDLDLGVAWNYSGAFEARALAYSFNNLNRGSSAAFPSGYADGVGLENRFYFGGSYADLGLPGFDVSRANFVSLGYYPTKDMVDCAGNDFRPGPFGRAYVTVDLVDSGRGYFYLDTQLIGTRAFAAKLLQIDGGMAIRPFCGAPFLEFRIGSEDRYDLQYRETETSVYLAVRIAF
jgi:hypothetical protein